MTEGDRSALGEARRIVVKFGTRVVTHDGIELAAGRLHGLIEELARLRRRGFEVVLVSSGAVGMGMRALGLPERPRSLGLRQACAAVGQGHLMGLYAQSFGQLGVIAAQVLLTQDDLADRDRALCVRTTLMRLLELGAVPILNENDSVSVRELVMLQIADGGQAPEVAFGDNDGLSALVARALDADLLILLTDVDGMYTANPSLDPYATRIASRVGVDGADLARTAGTNSGGTGGMTSKLEAAKLVTDAGIPAVICNGDTPEVLAKVLAGVDLGTVIWPSVPRPARRGKITHAPRAGALVVNDGAIAALVDRKASLLPIGVVAVEGTFERGDVVEVRDRSGRVFGRGLVNYDADAARQLVGRHSNDIDRILGYRGYDALVTRDNLVLTTDARGGA